MIGIRARSRQPAPRMSGRFRAPAQRHTPPSAVPRIRATPPSYPRQPSLSANGLILRVEGRPIGSDDGDRDQHGRHTNPAAVSCHVMTARQDEQVLRHFRVLGSHGRSSRALQSAAARARSPGRHHAWGSAGAPSRPPCTCPQCDRRLDISDGQRRTGASWTPT